MMLQEIQIIYKNTNLLLKQEPIIRSELASKIFFDYWEDIEINESFCLLALNRAHKPLGIRTVSKGGMTSTIVDERIIFSILLKSLATAFIIAHNHPSGNMKPSDADLVLTKRLKQLSDLHNIKLLDHLILSTDGSTYYSFLEEGYL